ncbi:MAG TPA: hypothetical protein VFW07_20660 [Parafilimonas sp.]|nr:hypothetical protein [Parafilimonas sp.]
MFNFFKRVHIKGEIFNGHFIDVKAFYVAQFNKVPCVTFIGDMDVSKAFAFVNETCYRDIKATYQHCYFNHDDQKVYFNNTIIVLRFGRMIEIADNYCQLLHTADQYNWAGTLVTELAQFRIEKDVATAYRHTHVVGFAKETAMN